MIEGYRHITFDGLDATGKTALLSSIHEAFQAEIIQSPPSPWRKLRPLFDEADLRLRFFYYTAGNILTDRLLRQTRRKKGMTVLQDRSWLTTLSAHELRGLSHIWLSIGEVFAKKAASPDKAIIVHVAQEERRRRLEQRGFMNTSDLDNLKFEEAMEERYFYWASRLNWPVDFFDNTKLHVWEAVEELAEILNLIKC